MAPVHYSQDVSVQEQRAQHKAASADHAFLVAAHSLGHHIDLMGLQKVPEALHKPLVGHTVHAVLLHQPAAEKVDQPSYDHEQVAAEQSVVGEPVHTALWHRLAPERDLPAPDRGLSAAARDLSVLAMDLLAHEEKQMALEAHCLARIQPVL